MYTNFLLGLTDLPSAAAAAPSPTNPQQRRRKSRSNSMSSSVVTVRRSASLNSRSSGVGLPNASNDTPSDFTKPSSKGYGSRRRSSVAHIAADSYSSLKDGVGSLNRWSQSTSSSKSSGRPNQRGKLSLNGIGNISSMHDIISPPQRSPPRPPLSPSRASPASSPRRRLRLSSPPPNPAHANKHLPPLDTLPTLLPKVYDPTSASSASSITPSSTSGPNTPNNQGTSSSDYFGARPRAQQDAQLENYKSSSSRKISGKSPLGSPPILYSEAERRATRAIPPVPVDHSMSHRTIDGNQRGRRGGSRDVSHRAKDSTDSIAYADNMRTETPPRVRERRDKDKKAMLSRALQKANTAVLLDNAQNFEGAMDAYSDACELLQQVMIRSSGEEDKKKLKAIRITYTSRIEELRQLDPAFKSASGKALPERPLSNESADTLGAKSMFFDDNEPAIIETATLTRIIPDKSLQPDAIPLRTTSMRARESIYTSTMREVERAIPERSQTSFPLQPAAEIDGPFCKERQNGFEKLAEKTYIPPPLSPLRGGFQNRDDQDTTEARQTPLSSNLDLPKRRHSRGNSEESISWLDTIDESGGSSCGSSVHSISSTDGVRRRKQLPTDNNHVSELDAAMDAAVEAAYDDGLEPVYDDGLEPVQMDEITHPRVSAALKNVEAAERVKELEREEMISAARLRARDIRLRSEIGELPHVRQSVDYGYEADDLDDEERMVDEVTKEWMLHDFDFDLQSKSALPRESDSSGVSGTTWNSSRSSKRTTAGQSSQSTLHSTTSSKIPQAPDKMPPPPPPSGPVPQPPSNSTSAAGVRSRRLSGKVTNMLKIDTSAQLMQPPLTQQPSQPATTFEAMLPPQPKSALPTTSSSPPDREAPKFAPIEQELRVTPPTFPTVSPSESATDSPATSALTRVQSNDQMLVPPSPSSSKGPKSAIGPLRKNKSLISLKNRALSISSPDPSDSSPHTPLSSTFAGFGGRKQSNAQAVQTPMFPGFSTEPLNSAGIQLFEADIHSPYSPGSPNPLAINAPIPLEPCPDSYLLRPFWLMRCFYQTIAHPRGGYLSTKLFVPRDVWSVKSVKLKAIEEKISNCDLLTAALMKLSNVDTYDADAVLEEMQGLEMVLDTVQGNLTRKLGNEVGFGGISTLFKDAVTVGSTTGANGELVDLPTNAPLKSAGIQSKNYLTSWRKLRSKNSAVALANLPNSMKDVNKDSLTMSSLPMTSLGSIRFAKRDINQVEFSGPNAQYMSSLARLFDAVQVLDQIARQVEDPGLKHSSQTHVGLELSTRHASEFFGFYICRFVLTDVTTMLDKFIKRGSEWVLV